MTPTLIRGGRLIDGPADILIRDDTIAEIGTPQVPAGTKEIDARGKLLHPGLINAHMHGHGNLAKGMGDRWTLELLTRRRGRTATAARGQVPQHADRRGRDVMKGCTGCYDLMAEFPTPSAGAPEAVGRAYSDAGMRAVVAPMVADLSFSKRSRGSWALPPPLQKEVERPRHRTGRASEHAQGAARLRFDRDDPPAVAPTIPLHCTDDFLKDCGNLAREYGTGLQTHLSESKVQAVSAQKKYGKSLAAHMDALGLVGPNFTAAHGVWLDDEDMLRLAGRGASVAHNPGSNMRLGSGIADMRRMLECGINVGIGTDGASSSDNLNMYEAMRIASLASKVRGPDWQQWITTKEVLEAGTVGSARALGFEKLGRLAPGYKADIVFLDLGNVNWIPLNDAVNALVHTEDGSAVHSVMVGGRIMLENRQARKSGPESQARARRRSARERRLGRLQPRQ
jgi:guanine deaminase